MKTTKHLLGLLCAATLLATTACNNTPTETDTTATTSEAGADAMNTMPGDTSMMNNDMPVMTDQEFMKKVAEGGHNEMGLSKVALDKGVTGETKTFANMMVQDHTKAGNELKPIAAQKNVDLPMDMDAEHKTLQDQMNNLSGEQLQQQYAQQMVTDHEKTVAVFQSEIQNGQDADVKAFAQKTLPTIQEHLDMARKLPGANGSSM